MVEIEVTRFEDTHNLNTLYRLSVEWNRGGLNQLTDKALHRDNIDS